MLSFGVSALYSGCGGGLSLSHWASRDGGEESECLISSRVVAA
jgi:hypothetical protein